MDAREQLRRLLRIQDLALEIQEARAIVAGCPARVEEVEGRFRERNAEYVTLRARHEELEKDVRERNGEIAVLEQTLKKYMDALMQVKNQREYAAMLKEIDTVKAQTSVHEEVVLKSMEEIDTLAAELESRTSHIGQERALVETEHASVEAEAAAAADRITRDEAERARIEAELPADLVETVRRIEEARGGVFMARAEKESCQVCYVRVRPQVFQEIRQCTRVHWCSSCRRVLYHESSLRADADSSADQGRSTEVEAANGGAV